MDREVLWCSMRYELSHAVYQRHAQFEKSFAHILHTLAWLRTTSVLLPATLSNPECIRGTRSLYKRKSHNGKRWVPSLNISNTLISIIKPFILITGCAMRRGGLSVWVRLYICLFVCVSSKNTAVCCLTARKSPRNSSLPLGLAIYILRKMPRKPDESSVECYGHGFLIAARPRGV